MMRRVIVVLSLMFIPFSLVPAFSQEITKTEFSDMSAKEKIREKLNGWKTPQIKSCFEPIAMAQKPNDQTYLNNILISF